MSLDDFLKWFLLLPYIFCIANKMRSHALLIIKSIKIKFRRRWRPKISNWCSDFVLKVVCLIKIFLFIYLYVYIQILTFRELYDINITIFTTLKLRPSWVFFTKIKIQYQISKISKHPSLPIEIYKNNEILIKKTKFSQNVNCVNFLHIKLWWGNIASLKCYFEKSLT